MRAAAVGAAVVLVACGAAEPDSGGPHETGWSEPVSLAGQAEAFALASGGGSTVVVFASAGQVWSRALEDGAWSDPVRLDAEGIRDGEVPHAGLDGRGAGFAGWLAPDGGIHVARRSAGGTWKPAEGFVPPFEQLAMDGLTVGEHGDAVLGFHFWEPLGGVWELGFMLLDARSGTWRPPSGWAVQPQAIARLALHRDGDYLTVLGVLVDPVDRLLAVWMDWDTRRDTFTMTSGELLNLVDTGESRDPHVAFDRAGGAHVLWHEWPGDGSDRVQLTSAGPDRQWRAERRVLSGDHPSTGLALATGGAGEVATAFASTATHELLVTRSELPAERVHAGAPIAAVALALQEGMPVTAWTDARGTLRAAVRQVDTWTAPVVIDTGDTRDPRLVADGGGAVLAWRRADGELAASVKGARPPVLHR